MASNNHSGRTLPLQKRSPAEKAIFTTLLYSDIFSFPLTEEELWIWLISDTKVSQKDFKKGLRSMAGQFTLQNGYYCLSGREATITHRKKQLSTVAKKIALARHVAKKLAHIPSILFIGISGGVAVGNAKEDDDVDFFIITQKETLFVTRLMILIILALMGLRRSRMQKKATDRICVNLLLDETALSWPREKRDVYTAREIAQLYPLYEQGDSYNRFLLSNQWIMRFVPNCRTNPRQAIVHEKDTKTVSFLKMFERFCRFIQISYMKNHRTTEIVTNHFLAFHPNDYRIKILAKLRQKKDTCDLLTKV